ncbi:MAG: dephospho-CoA kinase [Desulfobulbus propionicus]|nr:MAG: dephospho-CoA kinase [Desulfobulbus propionicus]
MRPKVLAVTGGIGSGKSTVARQLARACEAEYLDLDLVCRELLQPGGKGLHALCQVFGARFLDMEKRLDRKKLRQALFTDARLRARVDGLLHPLAAAVAEEKLEKSPRAMAVADVPLLFEAGWEKMADLIIVVWAPEAERIRRIVSRDQVTPEQARAALAAQMSLEEKMRLADYRLDNSGSHESTRQQVNTLAKRLLAGEFFT